MSDPKTFRVVVAARGCEIHDDPLDCEYPIQCAHILSQQALRRHGKAEHLWDTRNGLCACYRAHRRSDAAVERFPLRVLSADFWAFADEVGLTWLAERIYGTREVSV